MRRLAFFGYVFFLMIAFPAFSHTSDTLRTDVRMFLDFARFRYDETQTYLEIYYLLYDLRPPAARSPLDVGLEFILSNVENDSVLASAPLTVTVGKSSPTSKRNSNVQGSVIKTILPPGKYQIEMFRLDPQTHARIDSLKREFETNPFQGDSIKISDVELCSRIIRNPTQQKGLFYKNTLEVYPNPMRVYGMDTPRLYYYAELYNVSEHSPDKNIQIEVAIADARRNIRAQRTYTRPKKYESLVEFGSFDVSKLENGAYLLMFLVTDSSGHYNTYKGTPFFVVNPEVETGSPGEDIMVFFPQSPYFGMSEAEVDERFEQAKYIATQEEIDAYEALTDVESKRVFMFKFWYEREREHEGLEAEYYRRVRYANEHFGFSNRKGWQSDRGRVYIVYGEPDDIEHHPSEEDRRPYERWVYYNIQGGVEFIFVDITGFNDYKLVSSTHRDEIYDPNWQNNHLFMIRR